MWADVGGNTTRNLPRLFSAGHPRSTRLLCRSWRMARKTQCSRRRNYKRSPLRSRISRVLGTPNHHHGCSYTITRAINRKPSGGSGSLVRFQPQHTSGSLAWYEKAGSLSAMGTSSRSNERIDGPHRKSAAEAANVAVGAARRRVLKPGSSAGFDAHSCLNRGVAPTSERRDAHHGLLQARKPRGTRGRGGDAGHVCRQTEEETAQARRQTEPPTPPARQNTRPWPVSLP